MQDFDKLVDTYHINVREWCLLENIIVMVFGNDIAGISLKSTIYEFIIVRIDCNEVKMIIHLHHLGVGQVKNSGYNVLCYLLSNFLSENFLILSKNLIRNAERVFPVNEIAPNGIVGTASRKRHQQTVGIKNDIHYWLYGVRICSDFHSSITLSLSTPSSHRRSMAFSARLAKY